LTKTKSFLNFQKTILKLIFWNIYLNNHLYKEAYYDIVICAMSSEIIQNLAWFLFGGKLLQVCNKWVLGHTSRKERFQEKVLEQGHSEPASTGLSILFTCG
jgi:hypothetical protein